MKQETMTTGGTGPKKVAARNPKTVKAAGGRGGAKVRNMPQPGAMPPTAGAQQPMMGTVIPIPQGIQLALPGAPTLADLPPLPGGTGGSLGYM